MLAKLLTLCTQAVTFSCFLQIQVPVHLWQQVFWDSESTASISSNKPHLTTQLELDGPVQEFDLPKLKAQLLGSRVASGV